MFVIKYKAKGKSEGLSFYPSLCGYVDAVLISVVQDVDSATKFETKDQAEEFANENFIFENDTHDISVEYIEV